MKRVLLLLVVLVVQGCTTVQYYQILECEEGVETEYSQGQEELGDLQAMDQMYQRSMRK